MVVISRIAKINKDGKHEHINAQFLSSNGKWSNYFNDGKRFKIEDAFKKVDNLSDKYVYTFIKSVDFEMYDEKYHKDNDLISTDIDEDFVKNNTDSYE